MMMMISSCSVVFLHPPSQRVLCGIRDKLTTHLTLIYRSQARVEDILHSIHKQRVLGYVVMASDPSQKLSSDLFERNSYSLKTNTIQKKKKKKEISILLTFKHLCFQSIELWHETENGDLDICVKIYTKKETHMVSTL